jgi:hypothetical protein
MYEAGSCQHKGENNEPPTLIWMLANSHGEYSKRPPRTIEFHVHPFYPLNMYSLPRRAASIQSSELPSSHNLLPHSATMSNIFPICKIIIPQRKFIFIELPPARGPKE